jgi:methionyl-tRNA synthetase
LNLQGRQFSKSEGWTVDLETFFERYSADQIRYTLAAIAPENKDSDFTWKDFQKFNNADLADTLGNLVNRLVTFTRKRFEGGIPAAGDLSGPGAALLEDVRRRKAKIGELYDTHQLKKAAYEVIDLARLGNRFFDENRPWKTVKEDPAACGKTLFSLLRLLEQLAVCAWPIIPNAAESIFRQIGISRGVLETGWDFESALPPDGGHPLGEPSILFHKIEDEVIEVENRKLEEALARCGGKTENRTDYEPLEAEIEFPDFTRVDLRVGKVLRAEKLVKSKKLIKIEVDLGFETRQVVAGIAGSYEAGELPGRLVIVVANLKPRKLMGETSRGMILAAEREGTLKLLDVPEGQPGTRVH